MIIFRLSLSKYAKDLSGSGAELHGGRWNSKGTAMIYCCESRALCTTEIAVHMPLGQLPGDYKLIGIEIPNESVLALYEAALPDDWHAVPHSFSTQLLGDEFVSKSENMVLKVPSVVVPGEFNYLINPKHINFQEVKIVSETDFNFDKRLFHR